MIGSATTLALTAALTGWLPTGFAWNPGQFPIPYCITANATRTSLSQAQVRAEVVRGIDYWRSTGAGGGTSCTTYAASAASYACTTAVDLGDNKNNIFFNRNNWRHGSSTLGVTWSGGFGDCGRVTDDTGTQHRLTCQGFPDIELNDTNAVTWDASGQNGIDIASIMAHEYGHFLGLDHCNENNTCTAGNAVMYAAYIGGAIRPLRADDTQGVCALYPGTPGGVGFPCTANGQCNSNQCIAPGANGYCTAPCGSCPTGYACEAHPQFPGGDVCVRDDGTNKATCEVCQGGLPNACANAGLCISGIPESNVGRCAPPCPNPNAPDGACPNLFTCVNIQGAGPYCIPRSSDCTDLNNFTELQMGQTCNGNPPCASGLECISICTQACTGPGGQGSCPSGYACETFNFQSGPEDYCAPPVREGETCSGFVACPSGPCLRTGVDAALCYQDCAGNPGACNNAQTCETYTLQGGGSVSICEPAGVPPRPDGGVPNPDGGNQPGQDGGNQPGPDGGVIGPGADASEPIGADAGGNNNGQCSCDQFYYCEPGCDCDQECPCACDLTTACDPDPSGSGNCSCDPECYDGNPIGGSVKPAGCGGCSATGTTPAGASGFAALCLGVLLLMRSRRRMG